MAAPRRPGRRNHNEPAQPRLRPDGPALSSPLSRVSVRETPNAKYVERPTPATLDTFEAAHGFKLPDAYRAFALTCGAGELGGRIRMYAPLPKRYRFQGAVVYDLAAENERVRPHLTDFACPGGPADY